MKLTTLQNTELNSIEKLSDPSALTYLFYVVGKILRLCLSFPPGVTHESVEYAFSMIRLLCGVTFVKERSYANGIGFGKFFFLRTKSNFRNRDHN